MDNDDKKQLDDLYLEEYDYEDIEKDAQTIEHIHVEVIKVLGDLMQKGATPMQIAGVCQAIAAQLYSKHLSTAEFVSLLDMVVETALENSEKPPLNTTYH